MHLLIFRMSGFTQAQLAIFNPSRLSVEEPQLIQIGINV
jgi:hypothetical protein